jgi:hypothetical protein
MTESMTSQPTVLHLFRKWRGGDVQAGQEMAQKFSDWYYAISTIRIPDQNREPMENACQAFAQGIVSVTRPRALVDWAHDLLERELQAVGRGLDATESTGSDHPNAMTRNRSPTELIHNVAGDLDPTLRQVLALAYDPSIPLPTVDTVADELGGTPFVMLKARYALKQLLMRTQDTPFAVAPDEMDMDRTPISLYEAQRLASGNETAELEKWLLSDIDLCKDVAEFSAFVHALRGGALSEWATTDKIAGTATPSSGAVKPKPVVEERAEQLKAPTPAPTVEPTVSAAANKPVASDQAPTTKTSSEPDSRSLEDGSASASSAPSTANQPAPIAANTPDIPAPKKGGTLRSLAISAATIAALLFLFALIVVFVLQKV